MSELSTVAIKDGHRGHLPHPQDPNDAQRADRISRLAGLERVVSARSANLSAVANPGHPHAHFNQPTIGYFDASNNPAIMRERSTVGSASATGSIGGRTTWASGSVSEGDPERMSDTDTAEADRDTDMMEAGSTGTGGFSDDASVSLVGFGEGARTPARQHSVLGSPTASSKPPLGFGASGSAVPSYLRSQGSDTVSQPISPSLASERSANAATSSGDPMRQDPRLIDGMSYDSDIVDTTGQPPVSAAEFQARRNMTTADNAERAVRERAARGELGSDSLRD
jgi:hypothetical protein